MKYWMLRVFIFLAAISSLGFLSNCMPVHSSVVSIEGGNAVLAEGSEAFRLNASAGDVELENIQVSGQPFKQAWRIKTLRNFGESYDAQLMARNAVPVARGDVLLARFWARAVSARASTEFVFEEGAPDYTKSVSAEAGFGKSWTLFQVPFQAHRNFAANEAFIQFRLGFGSSFDLGGVSLVNYGKSITLGSLESKGFDYPGRSLEATWRKAAEDRIDTLRKADLKILVTDVLGQPLEGVGLELKMQRHAFPFGSAIDAERFLKDDVYQQKIFDLFNRVTLENDLKWPRWECCTRDLALRAIERLQSRGLSVRGHALIWTCGGCLPKDVQTSSDRFYLDERLAAHFKDIMQATHGQIVEWDVLNEPSSSKGLDDVLSEEGVLWWFNRAKELDSKPRLMLNDFGNLGEGPYQDEYKRIIAKAQELEVPLEGIGLQGHFGWKLTPPQELFEHLDSFAAYGLPLTITEFDVNVSDEQLQADYVRDFMTLAFSHPAVSGILLWGFWEGQHWLPGAALFRNDWSAKPSGQAWMDLVYRDWWTEETAQSDDRGQYSTRGFLGDYRLTLRLGERVIEQDFTLTAEGQSLEIQLP